MSHSSSENPDYGPAFVRFDASPLPASHGGIVYADLAFDATGSGLPPVQWVSEIHQASGDSQARRCAKESPNQR